MRGIQGEWVDVKLYQAQNGQKTFQGRLAPCTAEKICLLMEDGTSLAFERSQVAKMKRNDPDLNTGRRIWGMNAELIEALRLLEKERGIEAEVLFEAIEEALVFSL